MEYNLEKAIEQMKAGEEAGLHHRGQLGDDPPAHRIPGRKSHRIRIIK